MNEKNGQATRANEGFSDDMGQADKSVKYMAEFEFDTLLTGHGEPIETDAGASVKDLAITL